MDSEYLSMSFTEMVDFVELQARERRLKCNVHWEGRRPIILFSTDERPTTVRLSLDEEIFLSSTSDGYELVDSAIGVSDQRESLMELVEAFSKYLNGDFQEIERRGWSGLRRFREIVVGEAVLTFRKSNISASIARRTRPQSSEG